MYNYTYDRGEFEFELETSPEELQEFLHAPTWDVSPADLEAMDHMLEILRWAEEQHIDVNWPILERWAFECLDYVLEYSEGPECFEDLEHAALALLYIHKMQHS